MVVQIHPAPPILTAAQQEERQMRLYTPGVDLSSSHLLSNTYDKVLERESVPLPPKKNLRLVVTKNNNFTTAVLTYIGRDPVSHRHHVFVATGVAKRNPTDTENIVVGASLATYRACLLYTSPSPRD